MSAIEDLEYPRHLHKPRKQYVIVYGVEEARRALAEGWSVDYDEDATEAPVAVPVIADKKPQKRK